MIAVTTARRAPKKHVKKASIRVFGKADTVFRPGAPKQPDTSAAESRATPAEQKARDRLIGEYERHHDPITDGHVDAVARAWLE